LALTAILAGAGANFGLITIQRTAGRQAADAVDVKRIFSWLGLAPALANIVGPMIAGGLIDTAGFRVAYLALALLPLAALGWTRSIASEAPRERPADVEAGTAWDLLGIPGVRRLLLVNWLLSASWDVHAFVLPILGHERGFSASAIGSILGAFAAAVALVRIVIPWLAHRMREADVLVGAMLMTAGLLAVYPLTRSTSAMALCAVGLGVALGAVQPMIMSTLHQLTPPERQGQAIALRSMTINGASTVMPLLFGALGTAIGAGTLFWVVSAALGAGSLAARRIGGEQRAV